MLRIRYLAALFGGAMAGIGGRLPVGVLHAPVGRGHGGRPRLDRPRPGGVRHLAADAGAGRRLPVRRLHDHPDVRPGLRASQINIPAQFLSSLPYLATIVVLVLISRNRSTIRLNSPASLGQPFLPDA